MINILFVRGCLQQRSSRFDSGCIIGNLSHGAWGMDKGRGLCSCTSVEQLFGRWVSIGSYRFLAEYLPVSISTGGVTSDTDRQSTSSGRDLTGMCTVKKHGKRTRMTPDHYLRHCSEASRSDMLTSRERCRQRTSRTILQCLRSILQRTHASHSSGWFGPSKVQMSLFNIIHHQCFLAIFSKHVTTQDGMEFVARDPSARVDCDTQRVFVRNITKRCRLAKKCLIRSELQL